MLTRSLSILSIAAALVAVGAFFTTPAYAHCGSCETAGKAKAKACEKCDGKCQCDKKGHEHAAMTAEVYAVGFHAEWCGKCKQMAPAEKAVMAKYHGKAVKFVKFDLTNDETKAASAKKAKELGIEEIWEANQKTGFALLIDAETKQVIGKLVPGDSADAMSKKIDKALDAAS